MKSVYYLCFGLLFIVYSTTAQTHGNISAEVGVPINEFHEKLKDVSGGLKFAVYFPVKKQSNLFLGGGLGFGVFGSKTHHIHEHLDVYAGSVLIDRIPIDFRVTTNNNFFNGHFSVRYKHPGKVIQPYAEMRLGFNNFYTHTTVYDETYNRMFTYDQADNKINKTSQLNSLTYSIGGEGGFIFRFGCWGANIGVAYLLGGQAKYYSKNQISQWTISYSGPEQDWDADNINPETVALNPSAVPLKSYTDMLLCTAGVTFGLCHPKKKEVKTPAAKSTTKSSTSKTVKTTPPPPKPPKQPKPKVPIPQINPNGGTGTPLPSSPPPPKTIDK